MSKSILSSCLFVALTALATVGLGVGLSTAQAQQFSNSRTQCIGSPIPAGWSIVKRYKCQECLNGCEFIVLYK